MPPPGNVAPPFLFFFFCLFLYKAICLKILHYSKQSKQSCLKLLWKIFILPVKILTLLSSFRTSHCTFKNCWNLRIEGTAVAYLSHNDFKNQPLALPVFPYIALVKYVCVHAHRAEIPPSQKRNWRGSILYCNKSTGKAKHLSSPTHFNFTPKVGLDLPISTSVLATKPSNFSSPCFFSPPPPKGIICDYYWQANLLHAVMLCNRMHCLFIHVCSCLVCQIFHISI